MVLPLPDVICTRATPLPPAWLAGPPCVARRPFLSPTDLWRLIYLTFFPAMQWTDRLGGHNVTLVDTAKWPFFALGQFVATPTFSFSKSSYHTIQVSAKNLVDAEHVL